MKSAGIDTEIIYDNIYKWKRTELPKCLVCGSTAKALMLEIFGKGHVCYECVQMISVAFQDAHYEGDEIKT